MKISYKIISITTLLSIIFLGGCILYIATGTRDIFMEYVLQSAKKEVEIGALEMDVMFADIREDVLYLSETPPIQGIFRAQKSEDGFDEIGNSYLEEWTDRLSVIFQSVCGAKNVYYQLRYIDENGKEIVRVDHLNNSIKVISGDNLQDKSDRFYFIEANSYSEGSFYVSRPTLNREGDPAELEIPYRPVIRFAVPVFDENTGERKGIVIANVLLEEVLNNLDITSESFEDMFLFDQDGYYMLNSDASKEWGGEEDLNTGEGFIKDYGELYEEVFMNDEGIGYEGDNIYFFKKIFLSPDIDNIYVTLFKNTSSKLIFIPFNNLYYQSFIISLFSFTLLFFMFLILIRRLLSPLSDLEKASMRIGAGDFSQKIDIKANDEIGSLAKVFNNMSSELKVLYGNMDKKVRERTKEIETSRKELIKISSRLELATQSAGIGIWSWDIDKEVFVWDEKTYDLYGMKKLSDYQDYSIWREAVHSDDIKRVESALKKALRGYKSSEEVFRIVLSDKSIRYIKASAVSIKNKQGKVVNVIGVNWDVTKEKEVDRVKTEFVSLASHQLRTPLTSIKWYAEMLLSGDVGRISKKQKEFIYEISSGNKRMVDLVNSLLNVSRIEMGTFAIDAKSLNMNEVAKDILKELNPMIAEKKVKIKKELDAKLPMIKADNNLVRIIFQNLLSNAVKYTPSEGSVSVSTFKKGKKLMIKVSDNGYGIPKGEQSKIFSRMFRANNIQKKDVEGNGLGLYIVKSILDASGGKIWFESEENKGTTFYVEIPLSGMKAKKGAKKLD